VTRLYSITEAAELLNVPRTWLRDKVTAREVPHTRLGRHVRFSEAHLAEIVGAGERRASAASRPIPSQTGRLRRRPVG
jgi:excisionase family DNA binding protein